ncbi:helix-turn-helix transcriptional regulator [Streptomyces sp. NPDC012461]|uniref:Helix-turn-helix domain-containing protein n=2 Tax=unclassified Streptomyces TaxID=2593676 RepID=A0A6G3QXN1_9ACTN|nr:helix-turn-helix domain-containing protein [Streptomyces sp. S12]NEA87940.1 helix-turn-helix domain-containing protein [Streptomyces sp. SID14436]NEC82287.1 helix-turn-helix domain-containing protein [Streptomyces sp. SID7958]NED18307.1 helix-turn-helix domain-containing protein [Streptomyces sp. SID9913]NED21100.1 helix-turn-helix domain-containing protein [Streptomyces sp. SID9913]
MTKGHVVDNQLGATLRAWRDRLSPDTVGLPAGGARRSPGLRREELAELAGLSVDYLVRLEQGRAVSPSEQIVAALARALRLSPDERDHLHRLAGIRPPQDQRVVDDIPASMRRLLTLLDATPVAVFAADWQLVWWNPRWAALFGEPTRIRAEERNLVRLRFPVASDRGRLTSWPVIPVNAEAADRALVADLRRAAARFPDDPRVSGLVASRVAGNPRFATFWADASVGRHAEDRKTIRHPDFGEVTVDCDVLTDGDTDLKIVAYTAVPGSTDESQLVHAGIISTTGSDT